MLLRTVLWLASLTFTHATCHAMEAKVVNDTLILSGPVVQGDIQRFKEALAANPGIGTVVLRNSWAARSAVFPMTTFWSARVSRILCKRRLS